MSERFHAGPETLSRRLRLRLAAARTARGETAPQQCARRASWPGRDPHQGAGSRDGRRRQARRSGEIQARAASVRRLCAAEGAGARERGAEARRQFPLALLRAVLRGAGAELLHVPAAHPERHPEALAARAASPTSRSAMPAATRMSPRAPICRCARSSRRMRSAMVEAIQDLGLCSRGSGADNIRNVTGTPTAGIDPQELIDTRPYAREWHFHILNERALYGLPRKFNVGFDGGRQHPGAGGHQRHRLSGRRGARTASASSPASGSASRSAALPATKISRATPASSSSRGSDTGRRRHRARLHRARRPHRPQQGAAEIRARCLGASRNSSRHVEEKLGTQADARSARGDRAAAGLRPLRPYRRACAEAGRARTGSAWCCRSAGSPRRRCAAWPRSPRDFGDGDIRLTVWQNLLISGVPDAKVAAAEVAIKALGLDDQGDLDPRRPRRVHRQCRLPLFGAPTPSVTPRRSRSGASRASRSTGRSTSISPAAIIPVRSTTSATSDCLPARCVNDGEATRSKAITCYVGGGFGPDAAPRPRDLS